MREQLRDHGAQYISDADGYVRVEFGFGTTTEISEIYRALAVRCISGDVKRVLIKPGDDDYAGERALRDAFTMILLAGITPGFRLALVAVRPGIEARYRVCERDLRLANVDARLFSNETEALAWLARSGKLQHAA